MRKRPFRGRLERLVAFAGSRVCAWSSAGLDVSVARRRSLERASFACVRRPYSRGMGTECFRQWPVFANVRRWWLPVTLDLLRARRPRRTGPIAQLVRAPGS